MNPADIASWICDAQKAFSAAADLDQLKVARLAHTGDKAPISHASRSLGTLSPEEKASAGKLIGDAKAAIAEALASATEKLEASRDAKVLLLKKVRSSNLGGSTLMLSIFLPTIQRAQCKIHFLSNLLNPE